MTPIAGLVLLFFLGTVDPCSLLDSINKLSPPLPRAFSIPLLVLAFLAKSPHTSNVRYFNFQYNNPRTSAQKQAHRKGSVNTDPPRLGQRASVEQEPDNLALLNCPFKPVAKPVLERQELSGNPKLEARRSTASCQLQL